MLKRWNFLKTGFYERIKIKIQASPRSEAKRGIPDRLLTRFGRSGDIDAVSPLVRAARDKVGQHKDVSKPLLLAMNDMADFPSDRIDISMALFGWEQASETGASRITPPLGYDRTRSIWGTQENSTISAILLFHGLSPRTIPYAELCLYENPSARYRAASRIAGCSLHGHQQAGGRRGAANASLIG